MTINNSLKNNEYIEKAAQAGLSGKASIVYVALLEYKNPIAPKGLISKTNLHRQYVYDAIHELIQKNLVSQVGEGRTVKYVATSPNKLLQDAEKTRLETLDSVQKLLELYNKTSAGLVEIATGAIAVRESELNITEAQPETGGYLDLIGGAGTSFIDMMGGAIDTYEDLRRSRNIKVRYITSREDTAFHKQYREENTPNFEVRYLKNINDAINICIRPESVSFNIYDPEVMVVRVKSEAAVTSQRALFEILWNVAEK